MARPRTQRSEEVIARCRQHLLLGGATDWKAVKDEFPDVPQASFYRLVEAAKRQIEATAIDSASPAALLQAQHRIRTRLESPETMKKRMKAHLPAAPSPAVVATMSGEECTQVFDFLGYFHRIVADAELLRKRAVKIGEDGQEAVHNPMLMDANISRRLKIMDTYMVTMDRLFNVEKIQELYNLVIEEVGKADPEVQRAILARLRLLNDRRGLTMAAHPPL